MMRLAESCLLLALGVAALVPSSVRARTDIPFSPTGKYWVYFEDKGFNDAASRQDALSRAQVELLPRAAWRRQKAMGRLVDDHDLPLDPDAVAAVRALGGEVVVVSRWLNAVSVRADATQLERIRGLSYVREIAPVLGGSRSEPPAPDAPDLSESLAPSPLVDYGPSYGQLAQITVPEAHFAGYDGEGVTVAVFDTGFEYTHPAFAVVLAEGRLLGQWDFVKDDGEVMNEPDDHPNQHDHGTKVWSAIAGYVPGQLVGVAYRASFLLAKTEDVESETPIEEDYWVAAAEWADSSGAEVISSSLVYIDWYTYEQMNGDTAPITRAADLAARRGIVVVTAAGNFGTDPWRHMGAPADADSILAVGAVDEFNQVADFSSRGPTADGRIKPEVVARGVLTYTAMPLSSGLGFWWNNGTSFACPLVGGAAALLLQAHPEWTPWDVRQALLDSADSAPKPDNERGWGLVDTWYALQPPLTTVDFAPIASLRAFPNPAQDRISFTSNLLQEDGALEIFAAAGARVRSVALPDGMGVWSLDDETGRRVPRGVYFARLSTAAAPVVKLVVR